MQLSKLNELLKANSGGEAWKKGHDIMVVRKAGAKAKRFSGMTVEDTAMQLGLITGWYVLRNGDVCKRAFSKEEAQELMAQEIETDAKVSKAWGFSRSDFTIQEVK